MSEPYSDRSDMGKGVAALAGLFGGMKKRRAYDDYESTLIAASEYNSWAARKQGDAELKKGAQELQLTHAKGRLNLAQARADAAARGVAVDSGSAVELARGIDAANAAEENNVMQNAFAQARQKYEEAQAIRMQQELDRQRIAMQQEENDAMMFSSFLGGIGSYGSMFSAFKGLLGFGG